jgi:metallo-beta-lactamase class B
MLKTILGGCAAGALIVAAAAAQTPGAPPAANAPANAPGGVAPGAGRGGDIGLLTRLPTPQQWANPAAQAYVEKARALAGTDADLRFDFGVYCKPSGGSLTSDRASLGVPEGQSFLTPFPAPAQAQPMPPQRLADNFWWFGNTGVGAFLFTSNDGYILFDAMNNEDDARDVIFGGMRKVGLDPAKIKYVIYGHSHLDHTGGARWVYEQVKPKTIMGRDDWTAYFKSLAAGTGQASRIRDRTPIPHDVDGKDGMQVAVGDLKGTLLEMPGHTVGSLAMIIPVKYQGREHPILLVTAATDVPNRFSFVGGYEHVWDTAIRAKVEGVYQVHPNTNMNMLARTKYVTDNYPPRNNPLLYGAEKTARYLNIMRACTQARMEALGW